MIAALLDDIRAGKPIYVPNPKEKVQPFCLQNGYAYVQTSGTTAAPKIVRLSHSALFAGAKAVNDYFRVTPSDKWYLSLPLHHVAGLAILYRCLLAGAKVTQKLEEATIASFVPTQLYRLAPESYAHLRTLLVGGGPLPIYQDPRIHSSYGMSEMGSTVAINGIVLPSAEVKITEDGTVCVKGPSLFSGYMNTHSLLDDEGWFHTNDIGTIEHGKLSVLGRKDRTWISGGENISAKRVEEALLSLDSIKKVEISGEQDPEWGHIICAQIFHSAPLSAQGIKTQLLKRLPPTHIPKKWSLIPCEDEMKPL